MQELDGRCHGLVVVDGEGLALAPLDADEPVPSTVDALLALGAADAPVDVAELPALEAVGPGTTVEVRSPGVLRLQGASVLAWDGVRGTYVALDRGSLDVLAAAPRGRSVVQLAAELGSGPEAVGAAVAALAHLGLVELGEPAAAEVPEPEPEPEAADEPAPADAPVAAEPARPDPLPPLLEGVPRSIGGARIVAYRVVGRGRRRLARELAARRERPVVPAPTPALAAFAPPEPDAPHPEPTPATDAPVAVSEAEVVAPPPPAPWSDRDHRVPVFAVYHSPEHNANLGLGLIMAYARVHAGGALNARYDLRRAQIDAEPILDELARREGRQSVVLFSDYMWSLDHNLAVSAEVKRRSPSSLTVHGGPHAPKYEADAERFFAEHPHVDVLVRGEGELTVAHLLEALADGFDPATLEEQLAEVEGISFRVPTEAGHRVVRTPERSRAVDVSIFPSPYLTGEFDDIDPARWRSATVETNRGCPYGCTFCDWGSATMSRIRQFPLERVEAELEWLAARGISEVFLADANFGIFARDVQIAEHLAHLKATYGAPQGVICSFAKNTTKHTVEIVRAWVAAGMCAEGSVALQTTDPITLRNVARTNIKVERYDDLAEEFRRLGLPIVTDLLMGLPGATVESFKADLQRCIDREVTPRMMETVVLPNSPMNEPSYREQFQIETDAANVIVATSSYGRADFDEMLRLRLLFRALEHYGLLRHLFRWLQHEHGLRAVDLMHDIDRAICADPQRYPLLTWVGRYFDLLTVPPGGWPPFYDEVAALIAERHGIERDDAMDTVIEVQEFLMPTRQRRFPDQIELRHDYVAWHRATLDAAPGERPRLADFGPGQLIVDDPAGVCDSRLLRNQFSIRRLEACDNPFWVLNDWELRSDLMRPMATAVPLLQG